jgi:hypothetical protein
MAIGTGNISLQDVVDEIVPDFNTLLRCFLRAKPFGFDPTYVGSKDRLSNFKGYDHSAVGTLSIDPTSILVGNTAVTFDLEVTSTDTWNIESDVAWLTFAGGEVTGDAIVTISVAANNVGATTQRVGIITIESNYTGSLTCTVTQEGTA